MFGTMFYAANNIDNSIEEEMNESESSESDKETAGYKRKETIHETVNKVKDFFSISEKENENEINNETDEQKVNTLVKMKKRKINKF